MSKRGFTLIELLVVISIIGLLSTFAVAAFSNAQAKARDAKRISDIRQIKTALELYYDDNGKYPQTSEWVINNPQPNEWVHGDNFTTSFQTFLNTALAPYMPSVPQDPVSPPRPWPSSYYYTTNFDDIDGSCDDGHDYALLMATEKTLYDVEQTTQSKLGNGVGVPGGYIAAYRYCFHN